MESSELEGRFEEVFGSGSSPAGYRAPGRVNLIGEHTDYNGGLVLPIAIDLSTWALVRENAGGAIRLYSANLGEGVEIDPSGGLERTGDWSDYVKGIVSGLKEKGVETAMGLDILLASEVPVGRGLSSSAALELSVASALNGEFDLGLEGLELIRLCQKAENEFVGANTGIMDQYVSYYGREGSAVLIDTGGLSHDYVELDLPGFELLVIDTKVSHSHGGSEYNRRRAECEEALRRLEEDGGYGELDSLSQLGPEDLEYAESLLPEKLANRTRHVVEENRRVELAAEYLPRGEVEKVGELFYRSHRSLRRQYEVSCEELDFLVDFARERGVPGARMTGGGFGGASIHIVPEDDAEAYLDEVREEYGGEYGIEPEGFFVSPSDGVREDLLD